jgi:hypothetical protein
MSKNIVLDGVVYRGVSTIEFPTEDGGTARMIETDSIPSGTVTITENGTHDVTGYTEAVVNVVDESSSGTWTTEGLANRTEPNGELTLDAVTTIANYAFYGCTGITSVSSNTVETIGANAFSGNTNLSQIHFPNLVRIGQNAFYNTVITELVIPNPSGSGLNYGCCSNMKSLVKVDIGSSLTKTGGSSFSGCSSLTTLILRRTESIVALNNINDFTGTPFANGGTGGKIYVPSALIDGYKSATNWSTIDGYGTITWVALEGSEYE